jgi:outer membrane biosynthesis protein TonB
VVILELIIDCRGLVTSVKVLKGLPLGLSEAAVAAAYRWRWEPATQNGSPVMVFYNVSVTFRLQ